MGILTVPGLLSAKHPAAALTSSTTAHLETPGRRRQRRTRPDLSASSSASRTAPHRGAEPHSGSNRPPDTEQVPPALRRIRDRSVEDAPAENRSDANRAGSNPRTTRGGVVVAVTELSSAVRLAADGAVLLDLRPPSERAAHPVEHAQSVDNTRWRDRLDDTSRRWVILLGGTPQRREQVLARLPQDCPVLTVVDIEATGEAAAQVSRHDRLRNIGRGK